MRRYSRFSRAIFLSNLLVLQLLCGFIVFGQAETKVYRLDSFEQSRQVIPYKERYQFDQFKKGKVYLLSGDVSVANFNYNFLLNEPQFLNQNKDTLSLYKNDLVRFVSIGDTLYYHDKTFGYAQILKDYEYVKLGRKQGMVFLGSDKSVGYNQFISTGATDNFSSYTGSGGQTSKLDKKKRLILTSRTSYYFIDSNGKFYLTNKGALLKIFSKYRQSVLSYLDENEIDFKNQDHLDKLLSYCAGLR